jgi:hypothetical protein
LDDFNIIAKLGKVDRTKYLGEGSYSSVYHVRRKEDGLDYALKKVNMGSLGEKEK